MTILELDNVSAGNGQRGRLRACSHGHEGGSDCSLKHLEADTKPLDVAVRTKRAKTATLENIWDRALHHARPSTQTRVGFIQELSEICQLGPYLG